MRLTELFEDVNKNGSELFQDNADNLIVCVKKHRVDIRPVQIGEIIKIDNRRIRGKEGQFIVRSKDDLSEISIISDDELKDRFEKIQLNSEPDAEGFEVYREIGEYEAIQYEGEDRYIYTSWGTKQKLRSGDYLVRKSKSSKKVSGFVVSPTDFADTFEEI